MHLWRILWNFYNGFKCAVHVAGGLSPWFQARQGVHQGGPFSMKLYVVFNNDLLDQLGTSGHGARLSGMNICSPAYADDICLVSLHKPSLQAMLNIAYKHSQLWRYEFNPSKSHVMVIGKDTSVGNKLKLGDQDIELVKVDKHLGVPLVSEASELDSVIDACISKGKRTFHASLALGNRFQPVPPLVLSRLYWSVAVPQMSFGLELLHMSPGALHEIESAHMRIAKVIQGLPVPTSSPAVLPPIQWWSMSAFLAYKRLLLFWRILLMPSTFFCKQFTLARFNCAVRRGLSRVLSVLFSSRWFNFISLTL